MIITQQEASEAKKRAHYKRLQVTNPEAAGAMLKEHIKQQLLSAGEYGKGPIQILPLASSLFI